MEFLETLNRIDLAWFVGGALSVLAALGLLLRFTHRPDLSQQEWEDQQW